MSPCPTGLSPRTSAALEVIKSGFDESLARRAKVFRKLIFLSKEFVIEKCPRDFL